MLCLGHSGIMKLNRLFSLTYRSCVNNIFILNVRYSFHYTFRFKIENAKVSRTILKLQKNIYFFFTRHFVLLKAVCRWWSHGRFASSIVTIVFETLSRHLKTLQNK